MQQPEGEEALLRHYHAELLRGLRQLAGHAGPPGSCIGDPAAAAAALEGYSYEAMFGDYQVALCDYVRWMVSQQGCVWLTCVLAPELLRRICSAVSWQ